MTVTAERPALWSAMPGWGIAADLIPPELINARRLKVLRRLMAVGVVLLLIGCGAGYYLAARENLSAASDLGAIQDQTLELQKEGRGYADVVAIQGSVNQVRAQIAQVMKGDVDLVALIGAIQTNLPTTMTISQESITISTSAVAGGTATGAGLDTSGLPRIGTISLNGTGQTLDDLSEYVDRLRTIAGLVDIIPLSNISSVDGVGTQYAITIGLTNLLLSHRYDIGTG